MASDPAPTSVSTADALVDERQFVARLMAGEDAAYEQLVRSHGPRMLSVAKRLLGNEQDARDAVQEAFLSAFKAIDRFEGDAKLSTWLHRIVVNAALMKRRTARRHPTRQIDDLLPQFLDDGHRIAPADDAARSGPAVAQQHETQALVRRAIDELPDSYRTVLLLRDIEQLDTAETARILEVNENVVKVRLHRARLALRQLLAPHFAGESP